ncbi:MAG: ATP-binding protein [Actinomycetota bacterium]|nr:ATP-binding protein [Actinomycetota bacterium]
MLIEFSGLPATGKSTLASWLATRIGAVLLRVDEIEAAMRRNGLTAEQTGIAAYSVAHDVAGRQLRLGLTVIADAVNPVQQARQGWRTLADGAGVKHLVIETSCDDLAEHRRRVESRAHDIPGWQYPGWDDVQARRREYQPRTDHRLALDTTRPLGDSEQAVIEFLGGDLLAG